MKKNGFTLVEVLAVIVVLGLIGGIIIPKIVSTINNSKENSSKISIELLVKALSNIAIDKKANLVPFSGCSMNFDSGVNTCTDLEYSGKLPTSGSISVDSDGVVNGSVVVDGTYTYSIISNKCTLDTPN